MSSMEFIAGDFEKGQWIINSKSLKLRGFMKNSFIDIAEIQSIEKLEEGKNIFINLDFCTGQSAKAKIKAKHFDYLYEQFIKNGNKPKGSELPYKTFTTAFVLMWGPLIAFFSLTFLAALLSPNDKKETASEAIKTVDVPLEDRSKKEPDNGSYLKSNGLMCTSKLAFDNQIDALVQERNTLVSGCFLSKVDIPARLLDIKMSSGECMIELIEREQTIWTICEDFNS